MKHLLIKDGRVIDPSCNYDQQASVLVKGNKIESIGKNLKQPEDAEVIEASGCLVVPGLIDIHVHLRDPGQEYKEDIASGARAAAAGGFTAIVSMANTKPVIDDPSMVCYVKEQAVGKPCRIYPVGALTKGLEGKEMAEIGRMKRAGAIAFSDDGHPVMDGNLMRNSMQYAAGLDTLIIAHEEDSSLSAGGMMHEGAVSSVIGLRGMPAAAEEAILARDLMLLKMTGGRLHIAHLSTAGSVELVRKAKEQGLAVTAEVTTHHLLLTDRVVKNSCYSTNTKVNPPLRSERDRQALWEGLIDGTIDAIASDHAPHHPDDKDVEYDFAPFGLASLEISLSLMLDEISSGRIKEMSIPLLIDKMSTAPAKIIRVQGGSLQKGSLADITVIDPELQKVVEPEKWFSKSRNTPFAGRRLTGAAVYTIVDGRVAYRKGVIEEYGANG